MPLLPEHKKTFLFTFGLSFFLHATFFLVVIFTFTFVSPRALTYLTFLGSVLSDQDVVFAIEKPPVAATKTPLTSDLDIPYGEATTAAEILKQVKPQAAASKKPLQKIYIKSTFLPEKAPTSDTSDTVPANNEPFQLKGPLHVPLRLEAHDQN